MLSYLSPVFNQELSVTIAHSLFFSAENSASISSMVGRLDLRFSGRESVICLSHSATPIGLVYPARAYLARLLRHGISATHRCTN